MGACQCPQLRQVTGIIDSLSPQIGVHRKGEAIHIRSYSWLTKRPDCATFCVGTPTVGRCVRRHIAFALSDADPTTRASCCRCCLNTDSENPRGSLPILDSGTAIWRRRLSMSEVTGKAREYHLYPCVHQGSRAQSVLAAAAST